MGVFIDLTGKKFGKWVVLKREGALNGHVAWLCKCSCGDLKRIRPGDLIQGKTSKCSSCHFTRYGHTHKAIRSSWRCMIRRCESSRDCCYHLYGGRGIRVCDEWRSFYKFQEWALSNGYRPGLSIDRIDSNGDYEPSNCRWATQVEQQNNRRNNHRITIDDMTMTIAQWARNRGLLRTTLKERLRRGWTPEQAVGIEPR